MSSVIVIRKYSKKKTIFSSANLKYWVYPNSRVHIRKMKKNQVILMCIFFLAKQGLVAIAK